MPDTTGTINAKKLGNTGFTEDLVAKLYDQVGRHHMAIVDLQVVNHSGPDIEGKRTVTLLIDAIEPAVTEDMAEHLRELMRTVYFSRGVGDQLTLPNGSDEPTVEGVLAAGAKHRPHPFLPVDASQETPICDVCGLLEAAGVHSTQDTLDEDQGEADELDEAEQQTIRDQMEQEAADALHGDAPEEPDDEQDWEYDQPEGRPVDTIPDPFTTPATTG